MPTDSEELRGRVAVITGCNTGIGKETARNLLSRGAHVVFACRSRDKAQQAMDELSRDTGSDRVELVVVDLGELASVRAAADELLARSQPIHMLINNAGLAGKRGVTADGFELGFGVNHIGHFAWTMKLLDRLRESAPARIVNVSSKSHYSAKAIDWKALREPTKAITGLPEYSVAKLANVLFTAELGRRLEGSGVTAYAVHPGVIASDVWRQVPWPVRPIMKRFMKSTEEGATSTIRCATDPELADQTGRYYDDDGREKKPSRLALDESLARELWERSEAWTAA